MNIQHFDVGFVIGELLVLAVLVGVLVYEKWRYR
jgi:hypothetical protein